MGSAGGDEDPAEAVRAALLAAATRLREAGTPDEAVADHVRPARVLGIARRPRLVPLGRVWRLGVLLLEADGAVRATGSVTRAVPPGHPGHVAVSTEARREVRAAAFRGPFEPGSTVHYDAPRLELTTEALREGAGPLLLRGDRPLVRWSISAGDDAAWDLDAYLAERVDLLLHPPQGAS